MLPGGRPRSLADGPDCNQPINRPGAAGLRHGRGRVGLGDAPRVEVALPADPSDPTLRTWVKQMPGPVRFDGAPCSFPGHVWKSENGKYWNMVCAYNGVHPWARFTSHTPTLMEWKLADACFTCKLDLGMLPGYDPSASVRRSCAFALPSTCARSLAQPELHSLACLQTTVPPGSSRRTT